MVLVELAQRGHEDYVSNWLRNLITDTYLNIFFSKSNYWDYAVFQWPDARLTSALMFISIDFRQQFQVWLEVEFYMPATKAVEYLSELFGT